MNNLRAITVATGKEGWNKGDMIKCTASVVDKVLHKVGDIQIAYHDDKKGVLGWQSQYLCIVSDEKPNNWYLLRTNIYGEYKLSDCFDTYRHRVDKKIIASNHPSINNISLSDLKWWVENGCNEVVKLKTHCYRCNNKEPSQYCKYHQTETIISGCVVFERDNEISDEQQVENLHSAIMETIPQQIDKPLPQPPADDVKESKPDVAQLAYKSAMEKVMQDKLPIMQRDHYRNGYYNGWHDGASWRSQKESDAVDWISVKDRLPTDNDDCDMLLLGSKFGKREIAEYQMVGWYDNTCKLWKDCAHDKPIEDNADYWFITHWMKLPQVPLFTESKQK